MKKENIIQYLNKIKPFINLSAICEDYNKHNPQNLIDYNNLRVILNGQSRTRLSEEKLNALIMYLYLHLYKDVFDIDVNIIAITKEELSLIITKHMNNLVNEIMEDLIK